MTLVDRSGFVREVVRLRYLDNTWHETRRLPAIASQQLYLISGGEVWAFEFNKVFRFLEKDQWKLLANLDYRSTAQDPQGAIWLVTTDLEQPVLWKANP